jgi:2-polyprenyl-6-hydroxyphenyl methylase/3-demethylubiquinone-9 3-methyltransferase
MAEPSINADSLEIEQFNTLADTWWDQNGPLKTLHQINAIRVGFIDTHCPLEGKRILDVGCGGGILSEALAKASASVTGIDLAANSINVATDHAKAQGLAIDYRCQSIETFIKKAPKSFDAICCLELLEHVPNPEAMINHCESLLAPGGTLFLSTINRTANAYLKTILIAEHLLGWIKPGTHDYQHYLKPSELLSWCRAFGLEPIKCQGMDYNPLKRTFSLGSDVSCNYILACKKPEH